MSENLLITGGNGRLGSHIKELFPNAQYPTRSELNILSQDSINNYFKQNKVEQVLHLAALTNVRTCAQDKELAYETNVLGTERMLSASLKNEVKHFLYLSTACVFQGLGEVEFYDENSVPHPKNYYGLTKYLAEQQVSIRLKDKIKFHILRTNFTSMPWEYPKAFVDRFGTYLFANQVAAGIKDIFDNNPEKNLIHICGDKKMSMFDYAKLGGSQVEPLTIEEYEGPELTVNMSLKTVNWKPYTIA
jgi:dTDP-4-dehydrorhamnose reductase